MSVGVDSGFSSEELLSFRFPLHRACRDGDVGALCSLIQCITNPADLTAEDTFYGWTPIHWAAHFGKLECVMRMAQVGCGVNIVTSRFAQTPSHIAAFGGHPECLLWLMHAGADINKQDYVGETPLHKAARAGSVECIKALLMKGAQADLRNASGLTAADLAHAQGFRECSGILSNTQIVVQPQTQINGFCHNVSAQNEVYTDPIMQGRSTINGAGNRKRSFGNTEANHIKKAKTDGLGLPLGVLNGNGSLESDKEVLMENMNVDSDEATYSVAGQAVSWGILSEEPNQPFHPKECDTSESTDINHFHHHVYRDTPEKMTANNTVGSQIEHQRSVKEEQIYDHTLLSTMFLYHGS